MTENKISKTYKIVNKLGLHARASALLVKTTSQFKSEITVTKDDETVNGKSIMGILTLAAAQGSHITISASGLDADEALKTIGNLIEQGFNEK